VPDMQLQASINFGSKNLAGLAAHFAEKFYLDDISHVVHHLAISKAVASGALHRPGKRRIGLLASYWRIKHLYGTLVKPCHGINRFSN
jgi:hypothetical protein